MSDRPLDRIHVRDLRLRCVVGVHEAERQGPQEVVIDITLAADLRRACRSDELAETVDYAAITDRVAAAVAGSRFFLVERLAERIAEVCLADARVRQARVRVGKPAAVGGARTVEIEIVRGRP